MNGIIRNLTICENRCLLYLPQGYYTQNINYPVVYINGEDNIYDIIKIIEPDLNVKLKPFIILSVETENWGNQYTPWPAPALTKKGEPFGGCASAYLHFLADTLKPFMDKNYKTEAEPESTALVGYSLGGLAALYGLYTYGIFGRVGSLSGSLWYDGWLEFMDSKIPEDIHAKVYLSLGKNEEHSRNQRMAKVGDCTRKAAEILKKQLVSHENIILEWNDGGHFNEIPDRFVRALMWLMK